jgi:regulatory protein
MRITALEHGPRRRHVNVHLNNFLAIPVSLEICLRFHLREGDEIGDVRLAEISHAEALRWAMESALRLLTYRPRSEAELRDRLTRKGVAAEVLGQTIDRVRELRLIDDEAFARLVVERRDRTSPRARRLIASELRAKGIERGIAAQSVATLVDDDAAYRAATRRAIPLAASTYPQFRRRLTDFLLRRGFDHEVTRAVVARMWEEAGREASTDGGED